VVNLKVDVSKGSSLENKTGHRISGFVQF